MRLMPADLKKRVPRNLARLSKILLPNTPKRMYDACIAPEAGFFPHKDKCIRKGHKSLCVDSGASGAVGGFLSAKKHPNLKS
jgi:hypothetical protein